MSWILLIYTVPAQPSRKRAAVWRDVKRAGAIYLRDGVCALPEGEDTLGTFREIAAKVEEFGGQATVAHSVQIDDAKAQAILDQARQARGEEYADLKQEIEALLFHIQQESQRRRFTFSELEQLDADLGKLRRWCAQISARDYWHQGAEAEVQELLNNCEAELGSFLDQAYEREEADQ